MKTTTIDPRFETLLRDSGITPTTHATSVLDRVLGEAKAEAKAKPAPKSFKVPKTDDPYVHKAVAAFLKGETKARFGHYFCDGHELYYRAVVTNGGQSNLKQNLIAKRLERDGETVYLGNSSALGLIGRQSHWGHYRENRDETEVQRVLSRLIPMIPFSVFAEAKLDLDQMKIVDRGPEETLIRKRDTGKRDRKTNEAIFTEETVHFTGASLFTVEDRTFLFDVDRRELEHKIFNAFLVELPFAATSIADAYEGLKPEAVKSAEARGLTVRRQGEFFFIPVSPLEAKRLEGLKDQVKELTLRTGDNRPNSGKGIQLYQGALEDLRGKVVPDLGWRRREELTADQNRWLEVEDRDEASAYYFTGKVEHTGREHAALILKGWYTAVPNTAQRSFTILGEVD